MKDFVPKNEIVIVENNLCHLVHLTLIVVYSICSSLLDEIFYEKIHRKTLFDMLKARYSWSYIAHFHGAVPL
jgi:hypothetical protein